MKLNQNGAISGLLASLIIISVLFVASLTFGLWSFSGRQKYKNDTDQLISTAVSGAKQQQLSTDSHNFAIAEEKPLITFNGPETYGSIVVQYPRTWSSYINTTGAGGYPVDGYFYPGTLPSVIDQLDTPNFALRVQVENSTYSNVLLEYSSLQQNGTVTVSAYSLPKVPSVVGVKVVGTLLNGKAGTLIILPLRNVALEIWTDGTQYLTDFNNNILPNFSFSP